MVLTQAPLLQIGGFLLLQNLHSTAMDGGSAEKKMRAHKINSLPVLENRKLVGVVQIYDIE